MAVELVVGIKLESLAEASLELVTEAWEMAEVMAVELRARMKLESLVAKSLELVSEAWETVEEVVGVELVDSTTL